MDHIDQDPATQPSWTGHTARDARHRKVGTIADVYFPDDASDGVPEWLVVHPGPLRRPFVVPAAGARGDGETVLLRWTGEELRAAPRVSGRGSLTAAERRALRRHYGIAAPGESAHEQARGPMPRGS